MWTNAHERAGNSDSILYNLLDRLAALDSRVSSPVQRDCAAAAPLVPNYKSNKLMDISISHAVGYYISR